ncbi:putative Choline transport protein [Glarea lozoyensis 74030]|uniref:Putative Choline transport protein n=1 Tax=Glarea lozoyensis (strain ATCC 74030 / MF5533) TaxID=1104152 RepID=H0EYH4_GLAL7|nr:putative Choline transport protein [Glarea lozoyensis 74030]
MGELASMAPTAGGQYHWVSMLAPTSCQKFLSYLVGWINVTAWQANVSAGGFLAGGLIQALIALNSPSHVPQPWQTLLLFYICVFFAVCINAFARRALPAIEALILVIHVLGFFAILIPLVYLSPVKTDAKDVFTVFLNEGGFGTKGLAFMVGLVGPVYSFLGADSAVHMSEEIQNASTNVPRTMILSITINGILGLSMLLATLFCLGNVEEVVKFPFPFMAIFQGAAGTLGGTAMSSLVVILLICALIAFVATASRMTWSFARDKGMPGWKQLSKVLDTSRQGE